MLTSMKKKKSFFLERFRNDNTQNIVPPALQGGSLKSPGSLTAYLHLVSQQHPPHGDTEGTPTLFRSQVRYPEEVTPVHWL